MLFGFLNILFVFNCILLGLLILVQKGKGSTGLGGLGGGTQMLFGGSGGQDIFQKITWVLGAIFIFSSLVLAIMKSSQIDMYRHAQTDKIATEQPVSEIPKQEKSDGPVESAA